MEDKTKFHSTVHFPECRRKMKICKAAMFFPLAVVALNIIAGIIAIAFEGGFAIDNEEGSYLFGAVFMWTAITGIPSLFVAMGYKVPCFVSGFAFAMMAALIGNNILMAVSFVGVMSCVIAFYYICEADDMKSIYGYPNFREDCEYEYLRPTKKEEQEKTEEEKEEE